MLLCINRACHTAVPPKISRGLPDLSFCVGGRVQNSPAAGFPIIVNEIFQHVVTGIPWGTGPSFFRRIAGPSGKRDCQN